MIVGVALAGLLLLGLPAGPRRLVPPGYDEAAAYEAIAAELRRGASLRHAVAAVYPDTQLSRLASSGQPMTWVAAELARLSSRNDRLVGAGLQLAASSGASATQLFLSLAERVRFETTMAARRRVLSAQAKASALVVGVLPLAVGVTLVLARSTDVVTSSGAARTSVFVGLALVLVGGATVGHMARRAGR